MNSPSLFSRGSWPESSRVADILRRETVGGFILLAAAVVALVWANVSDTYAELTHLVVGPGDLHLDLSLHAWASDGLLAIFFFVVGLELKREFVAGDLRDPRRAALPVVAAVGGMVAPALIYVIVNATSAGGRIGGWAIPTATDIAFAVAVLAVVGTHLPIALRTFLLTLAVVDDLLAVSVIALFYTDKLSVLWLIGAAVPIAAFGYAVRRGVRSPWVLVPLAVLAWLAVHESGVHATVAGVLLGFTVPVRQRPMDDLHGDTGLAEHFEHRIRPISTGFAVPVFAFFAAGVDIGGFNGLGEAFRDPVAIGIVLGLVLGKPIGVLGTTWLLARFTRADLDPSVRWIDILGVAMLAGIGFTVSLLIGALAFGADSTSDDHVKIAVLTGSVVSAVLAASLLSRRNRRYREIEEQESADEDRDGIPDVFGSD